jgi:hypothetical protein
VEGPYKVAGPAAVFRRGELRVPVNVSRIGIPGK